MLKMRNGLQSGYIWLQNQKKNNQNNLTLIVEWRILASEPAPQLHRTVISNHRQSCTSFRFHFKKNQIKKREDKPESIALTQSEMVSWWSGTFSCCSSSDARENRLKLHSFRDIGWFCSHPASCESWDECFGLHSENYTKEKETEITRIVSNLWNLYRDIVVKNLRIVRDVVLNKVFRNIRQ